MTEYIRREDVMEILEYSLAGDKTRQAILALPATDEIVEKGQLCCFLGLYAPAPENTAPADWYHNAEANIAAWEDFFAMCMERGYYVLPMPMAEDKADGEDWAD